MIRRDQPRMPPGKGGTCYLEAYWTGKAADGVERRAGR